MLTVYNFCLYPMTWLFIIMGRNLWWRWLERRPLQRHLNNFSPNRLIRQNFLFFLETWYSWPKKHNYVDLIISERLIIGKIKRYWKKRMRRYEACMVRDIFVGSSFFEWRSRIILRGKLMRKQLFVSDCRIFLEKIYSKNHSQC